MSIEEVSVLKDGGVVVITRFGSAVFNVIYTASVDWLNSVEASSATGLTVVVTSESSQSEMI
jgi:hypothetical protein